MTSASEPNSELIAEAELQLARELSEAIADPTVAENIAKKIKALVFVMVTLMTPEEKS